MEKTGDETRLRKIVQPLEALLVGMPRLLIKDSAVSAVCHGGQLMLVGVIAFDNTVVPGIDVVIMTGKGEAVAIATAMMTVQQMAGANSTDHNAAAKVKRVLLDRDAYPKQWGLGPHAMEKKKHRLLGDKPLLPSSSFVEAANASTASTTAPITEEEAVQKDGKRKRDVESAEEKAERKKRKAEKKAAKEEAK